MSDRIDGEARELTELEGTVLGLVATKGPCTPYLVRKEFRNSPSAYWSGSAGTIYPVIERLERRLLIDHVATRDNQRGGKLFEITTDGLKKLKVWLYRPNDPFVTGTPPDPLRNRIEMLNILPRSQQLKFLSTALQKLEIQAALYERELAEARQHDNFYDYLSRIGGAKSARARLEWLREVSSSLTSGGSE